MRLWASGDDGADTVRRTAPAHRTPEHGRIDVGVGQASAVAARRLRKVRALQGRALGNTQAGRPDGKWHRNDTAHRKVGKGEMVR